MPLYFAYGANMDVPGMASRAPRAKLLGAARLARHRFVITEHGYASVVRDQRSEVHGLLWEVDLAGIRALDRFEAVDRGLYVKANQPVITAGGPRRALVYLGTGKPGGVPRPGYLEDVMRAAEAAGLPPAYLRAMAAAGQGTGLAASPKPAAIRSKRAGSDPANPAWDWNP